MNKIKIPIEVSARHVHLSKKDLMALFGENIKPCIMKTLSQPGQYADVETVKLKGPKGEIDKVRILGPCREETQVEISATDARQLGVKTPVRLSGNHRGTGGVTLVGPLGSVKLERGVIIAERHLHMSDQEAEKLGVRDGERVKIDVAGVRDLIFENVPVRVNPEYRLAFHIDTDEANAAWVESGDVGYLVK